VDFFSGLNMVIQMNTNGFITIYINLGASYLQCTIINMLSTAGILSYTIP